MNERLLAYVPDMRHVSGSEYEGPCPFCGGDDRFCLWLDGGIEDTGRFFCRRCERRGNAVQLLREAHGMSEAAARYAAGLDSLKDWEKRPWALAEEIGRFTYTDESGKPLYSAVRYEPPSDHPDRGSKMFLPYKAGANRSGIKGVRRVPYRLPELRAAAEAGRVAFQTEGERHADALAAWGLCATTSLAGAKSWRDEYADYYAGVSSVVILPDNDEPGRAYAESVARSMHKRGIPVRIVDLPGLSEKGDVLDWIAAGGTREQLEQIVSATPLYVPSAEPSTKGESLPVRGESARQNERREAETQPEEPRTQAQTLIELAGECTLFHTRDGEAYATVPVDGHSETHRLRSKTFRTWLNGRFYAKEQKPPGSQAMQDALGVLEAKAIFEGPEREVFIRVAGYDGAIYVDLCNDKWEAVRITRDKWEIVTDSPVAFRRTRAMLPLPRPERPGNLALLKEHIVKDDDSVALLCAWLVQSFRPKGPYPLLAWIGEQGTGKSTRTRQVRSLVDPSSVPVRSQPRTEQDLILGADNGWILAFDNLSGVAPWLSDALCRLSTGGGFGTRELYSDREEVLFFALRAVLLNGIEDLTTRPDLADRTVTIALQPIPPDKRRPEREINEAFERDRPMILAGIFDAVCTALANIDSVQLESLPRMADFAQWAVAAEPAFPVPKGTFLKAYEGNRQEAVEAAIESDTVASAVRTLLQDEPRWEGTMGELLDALRPCLPNPDKPPRDFPRSARKLSGHLKRLAPSLRAIGIERREKPRGGKAGSRLYELDRTCKTSSEPSVPSEPAKTTQNRSFFTDGMTDGMNTQPSVPSVDRQKENGLNDPKKADADGTDGTDGLLQVLSNGNGSRYNVPGFVDEDGEELPF